MASLKDDFCEFVFNRAFLAATEKTIARPEYQKTSDEQKELFCRIRDLIGSENHQLLLKYEAAINEENGYITEDAYRQGLQDGLSLRTEFGSACTNHEAAEGKEVS